MERIKIMNKTRYFKTGLTKKELRVVDYNSLLARSQRSQEKMLRLWSECERYNKAGGRVLFATLTYNDENLPHFSYIDEDGKEQIVPCFSKEHKNTFLHSLRQELFRKCGNGYNESRKDVEGEDLPFRYEWDCEFGMSRGTTKRPHYHCLFFFPPSVVRYYGELLSTYHALVERYWHYGFVFWSKKPFNKFVDSDAAARYASKYCNKDFTFFQNEKVDAYLKNPDGTVNMEHFDLVKDKLPFHQSSQHVGEALKYFFTHPRDFLYGVDLDLPTDQPRNKNLSLLTTDSVSRGKRIKYKCPLYIQRKTIYYYNYQEQRYKYTDFGKNVLLSNYLESLDLDLKKLREKCTTLEINKKIDSSNLYYLNNKYGFNFQNVTQLSNYITSILYDSPNKDISYLVYQKFVRGVLFEVQELAELSEMFLRSDRDELTRFSLKKFKEGLDQDNYEAFEEEGFFYVYEQPPGLFQYSISQFDNLEKLLSEIDYIYHYKCQLKYEEERERQRELKFNVS